MVCGHLDRNLLARLVAALVGDEPANLVTPATPLPAPAATAGAPRPPRAMPGALSPPEHPGPPPAPPQCPAAGAARPPAVPPGLARRR